MQLEGSTNATLRLLQHLDELKEAIIQCIQIEFGFLHFFIPLLCLQQELDQQHMERLKTTIKQMYLPHGHVSDKQLERSADVALKLLQHLSVWGADWKASDQPDNGELPDPASAAQATLQVLARVTKGHKLALKVSDSCGTGGACLQLRPLIRVWCMLFNIIACWSSNFWC